MMNRMAPAIATAASTTLVRSMNDMNLSTRFSTAPSLPGLPAGRGVPGLTTVPYSFTLTTRRPVASDPEPGLCGTDLSARYAAIAMPGRFGVCCVGGHHKIFMTYCQAKFDKTAKSWRLK